ncbi:hypothetical protein [Minwuia thermotolerans]|uniref:Nucleoside phosphorylase domain-containing protein n=1 Tax=Minwuia thermotolerans TaxID=2056226 RepID=A0A2M9G065_9PROT|nr:hypothetical protein [Minwuia thermotolerans]PJK29110.1 hypothetical protein CVT23_14450 [Minwuia thermotolerans]
MLGVLCGIHREGRIIEAAAAAAGAPAMVRCSGARAANAARGARELVEAGATRLLSFGVAGGLADDARPGDLLTPERVLDLRDGDWAADAEWLAAVRAAWPEGRRDAVLGIDMAATTVGQKAFLGAAFPAAVAVDMESHHLARAAAEAGLPFLCVRAVADDRRSPLPRAAMAGVGPAGDERPHRVLLSLLYRPHEVRALIRLARASGRAFSTLGRVGRAGPCLGVGGA